MNHLIKAFQNPANPFSELSISAVQRLALFTNYICIMQNPFIQEEPGY